MLSATLVKTIKNANQYQKFRRKTCENRKSTCAATLTSLVNFSSLLIPIPRSEGEGKGREDKFLISGIDENGAERADQAQGRSGIKRRCSPDRVRVRPPDRENTFASADGTLKYAGECWSSRYRRQPNQQNITSTTKASLSEDKNFICSVAARL